MMLVIFVIQVALVLFVGQDFPLHSMWSFVRYPADWSSLSIIDFLTDTLLVAGATLIIVGTFFYRSDFVVFSGITTVFFSFGATLYNFWQYIAGKPEFGATIGGTPWVAVLFVSPILLIWLYVTLKFWRGTD